MKSVVHIWLRTSFEGYHRWKEAPENVAFLRNWHRHLFSVEIGFQVSSLNRELEFFTQKKELDAFLSRFRGKQFEDSCEMVATAIASHFRCLYVSVSEDGENGATVTNYPEG